MKHGNYSWIELISYLHANPSQLTQAVPVMWFVGSVLLFKKNYVSDWIGIGRSSKFSVSDRIGSEKIVSLNT